MKKTILCCLLFLLIIVTASACDFYNGLDNGTSEPNQTDETTAPPVDEDCPGCLTTPPEEETTTAPEEETTTAPTEESTTAPTEESTTAPTEAATTTTEEETTQKKPAVETDENGGVWSPWI